LITTSTSSSPGEGLQRHEVLRTAIEVLSAPVLGLAAGGRVLLANAEAMQLIGRSASEISSRTLGEFLHETSRAGWDRFLRDFFASPETAPNWIEVELAGHAPAVGARDRATVMISLKAFRDGPELVAVATLLQQARSSGDVAHQGYEARLRAQSLALGEIVADAAASGEDFNAGVRRITELATVGLKLARASVWLFENDGVTLRCADAFDAARSIHTAGDMMHGPWHPAYFEALQAGETVAIEDVRTDARMVDLVAGYFAPHGIGATLDTPVRIRGHVIGVLCLEHAPSARRWMPDERVFSVMLADQLAQLRLNAGHAQAEQAALEATQRLREIFEHSTEAIFSMIVTPQGEFVFETYNPLAAAITGVSDERIRGKRPQDVFKPGVAAQLNGSYRRCLQAGEPIDYIEDVDFEPGRRIYHTHLVPVRDANGRIYRIAGFARDITAQTKAEQAVRASEARFRSYFDSPLIGMAVTTPDRRWLEVNDHLCSMLGYTREELLGLRWSDLTLPEDLHNNDHLLERARAGEVDAYTVEKRYRRKDGRVIHANIAVRCIRRPDGEADYFLAVVQDITPRLEAEAARSELESQLRQAQKLEALGQLAGGIAHDFNNILTAIMAYAELAAMDADNGAEVRKHLAHVQTASNRARDLVRRILAFSRHRKQERKPLQLHAIVNEALKLLRSTLPATIEIEAHVSESAPVVLADPVQVHQVMMNLGTNAAHAMRDRPGRLVVRLDFVRVDESMARGQPDLLPGRYARLSVTDTGHGMAPEVLKRIFEPFFTTKGPGEGTGLGLAVVHGIVKDHEGAITVESFPSVGSTFRVFFPEHAAAVDESREGGAGELPRGNGQRILFIDDEQALCDSARQIFERLGYEAETFSDPEAALERFRRVPQSFDLVITDLTMPRITGVDLGREIIRLNPEVPVLLATGFSGTWTPERVRALGIRDLVAKPLTAAALAETARRMCRKRPPGA
jgi:PAS domain S-box-containing protein